MSGHSKWSTIKRQKGLNDAKRGQLFSKLARAITLAAKQGGIDPGGNLKLKMAISTARSANMPKDNIDRSIERGKPGNGGELHEVIYEGYGPGGVAILIEAATDNRNRTIAEIKNILEKGEGSLGAPGSVAFQFEHRGQIIVEKGEDADGRSLQIIDMGVEDVTEVEDGLEVLTMPADVFKTKEAIEMAGIPVKSAELVYIPKNVVELPGDKAGKIFKLLENLDDNEDVQRVFANLA